MQGKPPISLVKADTPVEPAVSQRQVYLVVVDEAGVPTIRCLTGAQEMLFGEQTYLVIPQEQVG